MTSVVSFAPTAALSPGRPLSTHCIWTWTNTTAGMDMVVKRKLLLPAGNWTPVQSIVNHYTISHKTNFNVILTSMPRYPTWFLSLKFYSESKQLFYKLNLVLNHKYNLGCLVIPTCDLRHNSKDLLVIIILWFCPALWWENMHPLLDKPPHHSLLEPLDPVFT